MSGNPTYPALTRMEGELSNESLQFCVLGLGLLEDGTSGVGVFPQREKILISGLWIARQDNQPERFPG